MASFSTTTPSPSITSLYTDVIGIINEKFINLSKGLPTNDATITNLPTDAIRWSPTSNKWVKGDGTDLSASYAISVNYATSAGSATSATSATTATNLAGGGAGTIPYNTAAGTTAQLAAGTSGYVLKSNGTAAPTWVAPNSLGVGKLENVGGWSVTPSGTKLYFSYNGTNVGSLDSSGNFIAIGNVTAYGTA